MKFKGFIFNQLVKNEHNTKGLFLKNKLIFF